MLSLIKIKDIYQCDDTDHVYAIVRTGPRATWCQWAPCWWPLYYANITSVLHLAVIRFYSTDPALLPVPSPRGSFWGLSPPNKAPSLPKYNYEAL